MRSLRKSLCLFLFLSLALFVFPVGLTTAFAESDKETKGSGEANDPYIVHNWEALRSLLGGDDRFLYIQLGEDITCTNPTSENYLFIPENKKHYLDLNGFTIDRGLSGKKAIENGFVLKIAGGGQLEILPGSADGNGCFTGGNNTGNGGG
nr:hypothetical protein [Lachnospiraceae bacterium]